MRLKPWHLRPFPGAVLGQVSVGLLCDRIGRKAALVATTLLIVVGAILGTAAHGVNGSVQGLFWFLTVARGITGVVSMTLHAVCGILIFCSNRYPAQGVGGEYPASSTSASEAANEKVLKQRGPGVLS